MLARPSIVPVHSSAHHPASNSVVEPPVRSFKKILACLVNDHPEACIQSLPHDRSAYMNKVHSSLGITPNEMLMGFAPALPMPLGDGLVSGLQILDVHLEDSECLWPS